MSANTAYRTVDGWKPIRTAPKNGRAVRLGWLPNGTLEHEVQSKWRAGEWQGGWAPHTLEKKMKTAKDLASCIREMTYGELKSVARDLSAAIEDKESRPKLETPEEFAELLFDWAEADVS